MGGFIYFTEEQKQRANAVDLEDFLSRQGEKLLRSGREKRLASDHSITVRGNQWYDHATEKGGCSIDFVRMFYNQSFPDAVTMLLGGEQGEAYREAVYMYLKDRCNATGQCYPAKLVFLYGSGIFALFALLLLFLIGIYLFGMSNTVGLEMLIGAAAGIAFCNLIIYILHLFLSFKFGLGLSLFWGVFESLQCILYSNIELRGIVRYIPFAWSMSWVQDILNQQFFSCRTEKIWIVALTIGGLLLTLLWLSYWEGRKNYE